MKNKCLFYLLRKYTKIKAILHFSIIICLFAHRFIYYSILLRVKDKTGIDILFKEYYPQLYYYAYHLINDIEASKDIVSDAFEFLWNNYDKVNKATVKSFLYTYVRNKSIDYLRHQNVHQQTEYAIGETDAEGEVTVIVLGITITCAQGYHLGVSIFCTYVTGEQFRLFGQVVVLSRQ